MEKQTITILSHKQNILCIDERGKSHQIKHQQGYQEVPAWCADTPTFQYAVKGGLIVVIEVKQGGVAAAEPAPEPESSLARKPDVPTVEFVISRGYSQEVAEKIVAQEQAKSDEGVWPYGTKLPADYIPEAPKESAPPDRADAGSSSSAPNADNADAGDQPDAPNSAPRGRKAKT